VKHALLSLLALLATQAIPAALAEAPAGSVFRESCPTCGVVRSVKRMEIEQRATAAEREAAGAVAGSGPIGATPGAGLVATMPMGTGGAGTSVGSTTELRRDAKPATVTYEIVVRLDDGRLQLVVQDDPDGLREGDKVRIEAGKVVLRSR